MQVLKTIPIILGISLLVSSCEKKPEKYNLTGVWESQCIENLSEGDILLGGKDRKFTQTTTYFANGKFESQLDIKYLFKDSIIYSGTYKVDDKQIEHTTTNSNNLLFSEDLPSTEITKLEWLDDNSTIFVDGEIKCISHRS